MSATRLQVLKSATDESVNFVQPRGDGFFESRYVRRADDYIVCYLSSHNGCNRGCRMCHLTATRQTMFEHATAEDYYAQAKLVLDHYAAVTATGRTRAETVNFAWMSRGEPLANKQLIDDPDRVFSLLYKLACRHCLRAKFNISTIMPRTAGCLVDIFTFVTPTIYYSLYSVDSAFRAKWLPAAMPVEEALADLKRYQDFSKKIVKIHFALIEGENDSAGQIINCIEAIQRHQLVVEVNLVRYNPPGPDAGKEASEDAYKQAEALFKAAFGSAHVQTVQRVGFDVKASCGMFVGGDNAI
jgi:adenine C2-methylase RlmN of 23S rRNA A2503 and tRNA A37